MGNEERRGSARSWAAGTKRRTAIGKGHVFLYHWIRWVIPGAILAVGIWWLLTDVLGVVTGV